MQRRHARIKAAGGDNEKPGATAERISSAHEFGVSTRVEIIRTTMHTISSLTREALRHGALPAVCGVAGLLGLSTQAADRRTGICKTGPGKKTHKLSAD